MKNIIIVILLLLLCTITNVYSQAKVTRNASESAPIFTCKITSDTSVVSKTSDWFDASAIIGQTLYLTDSVKLNGTDSVIVIIQGRGLVSGINVLINLDTVSLAGANIEQNTLSLSASLPEIRFIASNARLKPYTSWLHLTSPTTNYLRERRSYGNLP